MTLVVRMILRLRHGLTQIQLAQQMLHYFQTRIVETIDPFFSDLMQAVMAILHLYSTPLVVEVGQQ